MLVNPIRFGRAPFGEQRDYRRIDVIIEELRSLWKRHPDTRLGQLISNAVRAEHAMRGKEMTEADIRLVEDDVILRGVRIYEGPWEDDVVKGEH